MTELIVTTVDDGQVLAVSGQPPGLAGVARAITRDDVEITVDRRTHGLLSVLFETDGRQDAPALLRGEIDVGRIEVGDHWSVPWHIASGDGLAVVGADSLAGLPPQHPTTQLNVADIDRLGPRIGRMLQLPRVDTHDQEAALTVSRVSQLAAIRALSLHPEPTWRSALGAAVQAHAEASSAKPADPRAGSTLDTEPPGNDGASAGAGASVAIDSHLHMVQAALPPGEEIPVVVAWSTPPAELPGLVVADARRATSHTLVALGPVIAPLPAAEPLWARMWASDGALLGLAAFTAGTGDSSTLTATLPTWPEAEWIDIVRDPSQPPNRTRPAQRQVTAHADLLLHRSRLARLAGTDHLVGQEAFVDQIRAVVGGGGLDPSLPARMPSPRALATGPPATALLGDLLDPDAPEGLLPGVRAALPPRPSRARSDMGSGPRVTG